MKPNCLAFLGAMISTSLLAQQITNAPPASALAPAATPVAANVVSPSLTPVTNTPANQAPAVAPAKKKSAGKKKSTTPAKKKNPAAELRTVPLLPGPAVVDANHVNVRGQAKLKSEILTRLNKGQLVTVIEEITRNTSAIDEPSAWAKIALPTNAHAWVSSAFVDSTNKTVIPKKLNLRSGPGENYSVIGMLQRGDQVAEIGAKGAWTEIVPPANAYAFVAAQFLKQEAPAAMQVASTEPATPPAEPAAITEPATVAAPPTEPPVTAAVPAPSEASTLTNAPTEITSTNPPAIEEPPPKRVVEREGIVRGTVSIQAPTQFALYSPGNGRLIDYLYTPSPNLDLRRYKGLRIIVTGEEGLEERWGNTPVITIQKIQVLDE
ncbi:MAG TPA: SH3 domain-containing protein [Verrucomicrobiae bacterium]